MSGEPQRPGHTAVRLSPMRTAIARRMVDSKRNAPHFYVSTEIDMNHVLARAHELNQERPREKRVTVTALLIEAVARALTASPSLNAVWSGEQLEIVEHLNIGVAIALDDGLIAPALLDVAGRSPEELSDLLRDLASRARAGKLRVPELTDGTFTVSNLGMFDVTSFGAIITPPQVAILATGRVIQTPVVEDGRIEIRSMMNATMSADHRAVDGAGVARFLGNLANAMGNGSQ